jgi:hypothetical protein
MTKVQALSHIVTPSDAVFSGRGTTRSCVVTGRFSLCFRFGWAAKVNGIAVTPDEPSGLKAVSEADGDHWLNERARL